MSDQPSVEEPEFPTHCDACGAALETGIVGVDGDEDHESSLPAATVHELFCPNPECTAHKPEAHAGGA